MDRQLKLLTDRSRNFPTNRAVDVSSKETFFNFKVKGVLLRITKHNKPDKFLPPFKKARNERTPLTDFEHILFIGDLSNPGHVFSVITKPTITSARLNKLLNPANICVGDFIELIEPVPEPTIFGKDVEHVVLNVQKSLLKSEPQFFPNVPLVFPETEEWRYFSIPSAWLQLISFNIVASPCNGSQCDRQMDICMCESKDRQKKGFVFQISLRVKSDTEEFTVNDFRSFAFTRIFLEKTCLTSGLTEAESWEYEVRDVILRTFEKVRFQVLGWLKRAAIKTESEEFLAENPTIHLTSVQRTPCDQPNVEVFKPNTSANATTSTQSKNPTNVQGPLATAATQRPVPSSPSSVQQLTPG
jgi:hypothetical protein